MARLFLRAISTALVLSKALTAFCRPTQTVLHPQEVQSAGAIRGFELNNPPPLDAGARIFRQCRYQLFNHSFGQYSGHAEATKWSPSHVEACGPPSDWRELELEMTGTSAYFSIFSSLPSFASEAEPLPNGSDLYAHKARGDSTTVSAQFGWVASSSGAPTILSPLLQA